MAAEITKRTLLGYEESESNVLTYELLIDDMKKDLKNSIDIILDSKTWKKKGDKMRFNAVVGNEAVICGLTPEKACNIKEFAA